MLTSSVSRPPLGLDVAANALGSVGVGEVGGEVGGRTGQRLGQGAQTVLTPRDEDQLGARLAGQPPRRRFSDTTRGTRDQRPCALRAHAANAIRSPRSGRLFESTYCRALVDETPGLLDKLLRVAGPSGYEAPAAAVWREAASFAALSADGIGSSIARLGEAAPLLAVVGHIDEIGLVVRHIDEQGFLWFAPIGGWDPQILVGQRVEVQGPCGPVLGVIGRKPLHLLDAERAKRWSSSKACTSTSAPPTATRRPGWSGSAIRS